MAEVLAELVARISADATELKKGLSGAEKDIQGLGKTTDKETKSISQAFKEVGKSFTIVGAAITASIGMMVKSFASTGSELHDLALKTGVSVKALAGLKYAAEQNGASLGTVEMAIRRTASAMQDAKDGLAETKRGFDRMGLSLTELEGLNPEEQFMKIASAIAAIPDPMTRAATAQDLFGRSGMDMLPMLSEGADGLRKMMEEGVKLTGWTDAGAKSADALGDAFGTLKSSTMGLFNAIGSSLAPILTDLASKITIIISKVTEWMKNNPELTKALSTTALVCGILATAFGAITLAVIFLGTTTNLIFGGVLIIIGALVTGITLLVGWFNRAGNAAKKLAEDNKAAFEKALEDIKSYYASKKAIAESDYKTAVDNIRKEYGVLESTTKNKMDLARDAHDEILRLLEHEYNQRIKTLNAEADAKISAIQTEIDAIDKQTESEDRALTIQAEQKRLRELEATGTAEEVADYETEIARNALLRQREDEKDSLRGKIDAIRINTQSAIDILNEQLITEKTAKDNALVADLKRLDDERIAKETLEQLKLTATLTTLANEETAIKASLDARLAEATIYQTNLEATLKDINQTITTTYVSVGGGGGGGETERILEKARERQQERESVGEFATGGIVPGAIGQPQLAIVHGGERITPAGEVGGITINFTQPVFFDREDTMNKFVDMIRKGIQRQDRLRYGGAYSG